MWSHRPSFTVALTCAFRIINLRDRLLGRIPNGLTEAPNMNISRHSFASGRSLLDAIHVEPATQPARASVLICHGIGEVVEQWFPIQRILADHGIGSLVFDYSGYGRSRGVMDWSQFEQDATIAFAELERRSPPGTKAILGFSLGTGVCASIVNNLNVDRMVLCASFTSFRAAARRMGFGGPLTPLVPPIWSAEEPLRKCGLPVLVVHSTGDRLFPMQMGRDVASWCGENARMIAVEGVAHNEPFYRPKISYWGPIAEFLGG